MPEHKCTCKPTSFPFTCPADGCARNQHFHRLCQQGVTKCLQHPDKAPRSDGASRGVGDTIAKFTKATGIDRLAKGVARWLGKDDCGCPGRQVAVNDVLPYALPVAPTLKIHTPPEETQPAIVKTPRLPVTIGITAFRRPESLHRLVSSIRQRYADVPIVVADNGDQPADLTEFAHVKYLTLPFDCGLSAARNRLIDELQTPYMMLLEEDFEFTACTSIERFVDVLESDNTVGVVGGSLIRNGQRLQLARDFELFRDVLYCRPTAPAWQIADGGTPYHHTQYVYNFCLFRIDMLTAHKWDESLKLGEHADYYYAVRKRGKWRVAHCPAVSAIHHLERPDNYIAHRQRGNNEFRRTMYLKWGIRELRHTKAEPESLINDRNVVLLGVGHSGTSVVTSMISALGWNWGRPGTNFSQRTASPDPRTDTEFAEHAPIRAINDRLLRGESVHRGEAQQLLADLGGPWILKDPRFVHTLNFWLPLLAPYAPVLIWLNRDIDAVKTSHVRRTGQAQSRGKSIDELQSMARAHFDAWPWPKLILKYEQLASAIDLWQPSARLDSQPSTLD